MASDAQAPTKTYRGNCHCGAFVYEATIPEIKSVMECGCSICFKKAYLLLFTPAATVNIVKGDLESLTTYQFANKKIDHMFCPKCGVAVIGKGDTPNGLLYALNARCIQGLDTAALTKIPAGGDKTEPQRVTPVYSGPNPSAQVEGSLDYYGSCHCGDVTFVMRSKKSTETMSAVARLLESLNYGVDWIYPELKEVVVQGGDSITNYNFSWGIINKSFCKKCGVLIGSKFRDLTQDEVDGLGEAAKAFYLRANNLQPVNLRALDNFTLDGLDIKIVDGTKFGRDYVEP
ncbi:unnamed protein product [Parascedosporium putredinis]|uniref:CENP-V/GFA domain-containing protein n=1 Tax=Parascedosporium putredinis TaxID=1442378 RepID=A0A9P1M738_9PEZI|nr:unnamed protein product [Parascedosporium putredinis]CAI7987791.1 unnamed protein product [Parascedosporium putredinis]